MASTIAHITVDAADPYGLGSWWARVLGRQLADDDHPDDPEAFVDLGGGMGLLFVRVPDDKVGKNRIHLDIRPDDRTRDEEIVRLQQLGATEADDRRRPDGTGWMVMRDPEGNEFCVERGALER